ncbi:hypothetical protein MgSA37_01977 [Mucilaginibacter gotjawali]|uniref:Uncharacterized protein n=2 Tax=Mucilaginibacter gotjawali TaxID=1550579 RepID=A0A0X8X198_9SPHI|nr:hypothetical protein [Mucilaginibacter gotjawali]BAU53806.1 hypothetical protein MgSA37_01977 [Mucilaginibacter gotjawali]
MVENSDVESYNQLKTCVLYNSPLERGCAGLCSGGGVLADILVNTPLHPCLPAGRPLKRGIAQARL